MPRSSPLTTTTPAGILTTATRWSLGHGNALVPCPWRATVLAAAVPLHATAGRWRRDDRQPDPRFRHMRPLRTLENTANHNFTPPRSRRNDSAPLGAGVKAKARLRRVDLRSSLDPNPSPAYARIDPGNRPNRSQLSWTQGLTRPRSFRDDLRLPGTVVAFGYAFRVDRTWQNQNHVSAVQGPVVVVRPVRKRVPAISPAT